MSSIPRSKGMSPSGLSICGRSGDTSDLQGGEWRCAEGDSLPPVAGLATMLRAPVEEHPEPQPRALVRWLRTTAVERTADPTQPSGYLCESNEIACPESLERPQVGLAIGLR